MGDKITSLGDMGATVPASGDLLTLVDVSDTSLAATGTNKKWTWIDFLRELFATRFGADAGATDTYVVTLAPAPAAYVTGEHYRFKANTANTGACTVNFNSLGAKTIKKAAGGITTDLADNDIRAGQWVDLVFDGTNFQIQSTLGNTVTSAAPSGSAGGALSGTYPNPDLAAAVAGSGLGISSNVLSVNVDDSTVEINSDTLRVKDAGITAAKLATNLKTTTLPFIIDGGGATITTGIKGDLGVDFNCTIQSVTMLADQSGSIVVDIWKDTYANFPPVDADSITASVPPTISTASKSQDATLTGWTTSLSAGDILRFNVDSVTSIQRVTIWLKVVLT